MSKLDPVSAWAASVNWDAWAGVGTLAAVIWAIWLAGQATRDARRRDAAKIEAVMVLAMGLGQIYLERARRVMADLPDDAENSKFNAFQQLRVFSEGLVLTDLPSAGTVDAYLRIATRLQIVTSLNEARKAGKLDADEYGKACLSAAAHMTEAFKDLGTERRSILRPVLSRVFPGQKSEAV